MVSKCWVLLLQLPGTARSVPPSAWTLLKHGLTAINQLLAFRMTRNSAWTPEQRLIPSAGLHVALLYLWQIDLLRLDHLAAMAREAGLYVISADLPASQLVPQVRARHPHSLHPAIPHAAQHMTKQACTSSGAICVTAYKHADIMPASIGRRKHIFMTNACASYKLPLRRKCRWCRQSAWWSSLHHWGSD